MLLDSTMTQLDRQADMRRAGADAQAIQSGAFGGSRQGVQRAETERNLQNTKADTLARLFIKWFWTSSKSLTRSRKIVR